MDFGGDAGESNREVTSDSSELPVSVKHRLCVVCLKDFQLQIELQKTEDGGCVRNQDGTKDEDKKHVMESLCGILQISAEEFVDNLIKAAICDECDARIFSISHILISITKLENELEDLKRTVENDLDRIPEDCEAHEDDDRFRLHQLELQLRNRICLSRKQGWSGKTVGKGEARKVAEVAAPLNSIKAKRNTNETGEPVSSYAKPDKKMRSTACDLVDERPTRGTRHRIRVTHNDSADLNRSTQDDPSDLLENADDSPELKPKTRPKKRTLKRSNMKSKRRRNHEEARSKDEEKAHKCKVKDCATLLDCYEEWVKHLTVSHNMFVCDYRQSPSNIYCNKIYDTVDARDSHLKRYHLKVNMRKKYQCEECPSSFLTLGKLEDHIKKHKGINDVECQDCGQAFRNEFDLSKHRRKLHGEPYPFVCEVCNKGFNYKNHLKIHSAQHGGKQIECEYCHQRFYARGSLKLHYISHHSESKKYICQICGKDFPLQGTLNRHQLVHTTERSYPCPTCEKAFKSPKDLHKHSVLHSEVKSYLCHLCGAAFRRKDYADIHLKTHESGRKRPFFSRDRKLNPTTGANSQDSDHANLSTPDNPLPNVQPGGMNAEVHTYYLHTSLPIDAQKAYQ